MDKPAGIAIKGEAKYLSLYEIANKDVVNSEGSLKLRDKESLLPSDSFEAITVMLPKFARGIYEEMTSSQEEYTFPPTKYLLMVGEEIPLEKQSDLNVWYLTEHIPIILQIPGFVTARRFELLDGKSPIHYNKDNLSGLTQQVAGKFSPILGSGGAVSTFLTLYDIEDEDVIENEAFLNEIVSPEIRWKESGFRKSICSLYQRIYPEV
jgi:hypothetical protein